MRVLLITIGMSRVLGRLREDTTTDLAVIDCVSDASSGKRYIGKSELYSLIMKLKVDILLTYRCPYILPNEIMLKPRLGAYNIHPSLLPNYSGLNPWDDIYRNKESVSGVTLHKMAEVVDSGKILFQESFPITIGESLDHARDKADSIASDMVARLLERFSGAGVVDVERTVDCTDSGQNETYTS